MRNRHPTEFPSHHNVNHATGNRIRRPLIRIESSLFAQGFDQMSGRSGIS